jgi:hypothetical protein
MKKSLRLALLTGASFVALAFAGQALAAYNPSLTIEQSSYKLGAPFTADLFIAASPTDDPSAKLTVFSPAGYGVNLSKAPGTELGAAAALIQVAGAANIPVAGRVVAANPSDPTVMAISTRCTGTPTNQAVLAVNLTVQNQTLPFLVFANKVGPLATFQICVPHPSDAPLGARVLLLDATIRGVFTNPTTRGGYEWATLFTPYLPNKTPNPAGTIQWRTYVGLPSSLTLKRAKTRRGLKFVGRLAVTGLTPTRIRLNLYAGRRPRPAPNATSGGTGKRVARTARLPASGKYSIRRRAVRFTTFFQMRFANYLTECNTTLPGVPPVRCTGEDLAAITSNQVRVRKPRRR